MGQRRGYYVTMRVPIFEQLQYWTAQGESKMDFTSDKAKAFVLETEEQAIKVLGKSKSKWGTKFQFAVQRMELEDEY